MTVVALAPDDDRIDALYVSVMLENLKKLGTYELLQGKVTVFHKKTYIAKNSLIKIALQTR